MNDSAYTLHIDPPKKKLVNTKKATMLGIEVFLGKNRDGLRKEKKKSLHNLK